MEVRKATAAAYEYEGPVYLRLGTNKEPEIYEQDYRFEIGKGVTLRNGNDVTLIGTGSILKDILDAADILDNEGIHTRVINIHTIKPIDKEIIQKAIDETGKIITVEDHNIIGGLGSAVSEVIAEYGKGVTFKRLGLANFSNGYGTYAQVKAANGIGIQRICDEVKNCI
jgi:transketolase